MFFQAFQEYKPYYCRLITTQLFFSILHHHSKILSCQSTMYFLTCQKENWEKPMWYLKSSVTWRNSELSLFQKEHWSGGPATPKNPSAWIGRDSTGLSGS